MDLCHVRRILGNQQAIEAFYERHPEMCCTRPMPWQKPPKEPSPPCEPKASADEKRAALGDHAILVEGLSALCNKLKGGDALSVEIETLLSASNSLSAYLSATVPTQFYNERCADAVDRLSQLPSELFEMILTHLDIPSILNVMQTSRELKARIDNSPPLQTQLCLRAVTPETPFSTNFATCLAHAPGGGFHCVYTPLRHQPTDGVEVTAGFFPQGSGQQLLRIGTTWRRMLLTQPPIAEILPNLHCCARAPVPIKNASGLTIGDVYDATQKLIAEHRWCTNERSSHYIHEVSHQTMVRVQLVGQATLLPDDPIVKRAWAQGERCEAKERQRRFCMQRIAAYRSAKDAARDAGETIPSLPQWLDANPEWKDLPKEAATVVGHETFMIPNDAFSFNYEEHTADADQV